MVQTSDEWHDDRAIMRFTATSTVVVHYANQRKKNRDKKYLSLKKYSIVVGTENSYCTRSYLL